MAKAYRLEYETLYDGWDGIYGASLPMNGAGYTLRRLALLLTDDHSYQRSDRPTQWYERCLSACSSMQQLFKWFGHWMPKLLAAGAVVAVYEVPDADIIYNGDQIAVPIKSMKLLRRGGVEQ